MKQTIAGVLAAAAIAGAACTDHDRGPAGVLASALPADSSGDSTIQHRPPGPVASVTVEPPADTALVGDSAVFFATLRDSRGNVLSGPDVRWTVADPSVARIEAAFERVVILRALQVGATTVTATSQGKSGSAQLVVVESLPPPPPSDSVATVVVTPPTDTVAVGDSAGFFANLYDANGNPLTRPVSWTVSDSTVARIEGAFGQSVILRAQRVGEAIVTATSEGKSGSARLVVR